MALRDKLKKRNCFQKFSIPEWDTGGEVVTIRSMNDSELESLTELAEAEKTKETARRFGYLACAAFLGDSAGNRVYEDTEEDLNELRANIPLVVVRRVVEAGMAYNGMSTPDDETKKKSA